jgi:LysR family transcriptional regulator (chromosome initiation inhibitor)
MINVNVDGQQLAAFAAAVIELGSFDAAAELLHVTPSAVSQRIKALEQRVGQVLVVREKPCTATAAGIPLLRLAAQTALLESEALAEMGGSEGIAARIAVAVNADSIATWFTGVFSELDGVLFDIRIEDQDHSARLLREGVVMGAVTTERTPVAGCRVQPLGVMRYIPVASKAYIKRYLRDGFTAYAVAEAPSLAWNRDDALQDMLVRKAFRRHVARPQHFVPTAEGFGAAVRAGLGWGMFPESLAASAIEDGSFVRVAEWHLDVPLYWQCWKLDSPMVKKITDAVSSAGADLRAGKSLGHRPRSSGYVNE